MKASTFIALVICSASSFGQSSPWTNPARIVPGDYEDVHPTIADGMNWLTQNNEELLAFSRGGKDICAVWTSARGAVWSDSVAYVSSDSADNDFPSMVRASPYSARNGEVMLVWQGRRRGNLDILFSIYARGTWSAPQSVASDALNDRRPHVAFRDSTYHVVWDQEGRILYSEYRTSGWSMPHVVSQVGDTLNSLPQVAFVYQYPPSSYRPIVVWQKRKPNSRFFALMTAFRTQTGWSAPDTLVSAGDNRSPRVVKYVGSGITWEKRIDSSTAFTTYSGYFSISSGKVNMASVSPLHYWRDTTQNASINGFNIITANPAFVYYSAGTWERPGNDSIGVGLRPSSPFYTWRLSPPGATLNRNPTISQGVPVQTGGFTIRFWSVWEAFVSGKWRLYGANAIIVIDDVPDQSDSPGQFRLNQNYPNPFNPTTRIEYAIPKTSHVSVKVFDLLGREVATLVDEEQGAGFKSVEFDAKGLASGVYLYRLHAGTFVQTKKLAVVR